MDRRYAAMTMVLSLLLAAPAVAQYVGPGGAARTVEEILANPVDDETVTLRGHIVRGLGDSMYLFDDGTGEIRVEIDSKKFPPGKPVSEKDSVEIHGTVDREFLWGTEIDVKRLTIVSTG